MFEVPSKAELPNYVFKEKLEELHKGYLQLKLFFIS
jgi:hypothetical protein